MWEMFSYGFQPWAAHTGQQILEAIDQPNCQVLTKTACIGWIPVRFNSSKLQEYELNNEFVILFSVWSNRYIALLSII